MIRKAMITDIDSVTAIYDKIHTAEENGEVSIGWIRGIYPEREHALAALDRGDLFVMENEGRIVGTAIINKIQVDAYENAGWEYDVTPDKVMVLHTLVISPEEIGKGYGREFVKFYEEYALNNDSPYLRMDTNERNLSARRFYKSLDYKEIGVVPCVFNGIPGVQLVLLEKYLG